MTTVSDVQKKPDLSINQSVNTSSSADFSSKISPTFVTSDAMKAQIQHAFYRGNPSLHVAGFIDYINKNYLSARHQGIKKQMLSQFEAFFKANNIALPAGAGRNLLWLQRLDFSRLPLQERAKFVTVMVFCAGLLAMSSATAQMRQTKDPRGGSVWDNTHPDVRAGILLSAYVGGLFTAIGMTTLIFGQGARNSISLMMRTGFGITAMSFGIQVLGDTRSIAQIQNNVRTAWARLSPYAARFTTYIYDNIQAVAKKKGITYPPAWSAGPSAAAQDQLLDSTFGAVQNNSTTVAPSDKTELRRLLKYNTSTSQFPSPTPVPRYVNFLHSTMHHLLINWMNSLSSADLTGFYNGMNPKL